MDIYILVLCSICDEVVFRTLKCTSVYIRLKLQIKDMLHFNAGSTSLQRTFLSVNKNFLLRKEDEADLHASYRK